MTTKKQAALAIILALLPFFLYGGASTPLETGGQVTFYYTINILGIFLSSISLCIVISLWSKRSSVELGHNVAHRFFVLGIGLLSTFQLMRSFGLWSYLQHLLAA